MKSALAVLLVLLFFSCGRKVVPVVVQKQVIKVNELVADNISEDISGDDEVYLLIFQANDSIPNFILQKEWKDSMVFKKVGNQLRKSLNYNLNIKGLPIDKVGLFFILIEMDTPRSINEITEKVKLVLVKENGLYSDSLTSKINDAIYDDDVLETRFYKISELKSNQTGTIVFSGINIFDKYYYRLNYHWE